MLSFIRSSPIIKRSNFLRFLTFTTEPTNSSLHYKFKLDDKILKIPSKSKSNNPSITFKSLYDSQKSPLANKLFNIDGVSIVSISIDTISVFISSKEWDLKSIKLKLMNTISDYDVQKSGPILDPSIQIYQDTLISPYDTETIAIIKDIIESHIRPALQKDNGDVQFIDFNPENGLVKIKLIGACSGCPSVNVTLKQGIEKLLTHYVPEVKTVERVLDEDDQACTMDNKN